MRIKRFRLRFFEKKGFMTIQRRVCFLWITLVDDKGDDIQFKYLTDAEHYLNREKKFGEIFIINYQKIMY